MSISAGRSGAMPRTTISLAGPGPEPAAATARGKAAPASGSSFRGSTLAAIPFVENFEAAQRKKLVVFLDSRCFLRHQSTKSAGGNDFRRVRNFGANAIHERVDHTGVAEHQT